MELDRIFDLLDASAKKYPIKALADEIGKGESTLRNELQEQPGYKLGLRTAVLILRRTLDLRPLDGLEEMFGRVAFQVPKSSGNDVTPILRQAGITMQEFGDHTQALANALADGMFTRAEAVLCLKELNDVIAACIHLKALLENIHDDESRSGKND